MLVLKFRVRKQSHKQTEPIKSVRLLFPDGSSGQIKFLQLAGTTVSVGFELPRDVQIVRDDLQPLQSFSPVDKARI